LENVVYQGNNMTNVPYITWCSTSSRVTKICITASITGIIRPLRQYIPWCSFPSVAILSKQYPQKDYQKQIFVITRQSNQFQYEFYLAVNRSKKIRYNTDQQLNILSVITFYCAKLV